MIIRQPGKIILDKCESEEKCNVTCSSRKRKASGILERNEGKNRPSQTAVYEKDPEMWINTQIYFISSKLKEPDK